MIRAQRQSDKRSIRPWAGAEAGADAEHTIRETRVRQRIGLRSFGLALPTGRFQAAHIAALFGAVYIAAYAAGLVIRPSETYLRFQTDIAYNLLPLGAFFLALIPIRRSRGRERLGWLCLATMIAGSQLGDWTYTYYDLAWNSAPPFPGLPDAGYYPGYLGLIAAVPLLTFPERRLSDRRWLLDTATVMVVAGAIAWEFVMRPVLEESGGDPFAAVVALGYPLLDLALLTAVVASFYLSGGVLSLPARLLGAAALCQIVADMAYVYVVTTTGYDPIGNPMELGWLGAYALLAVCFTLPQEAFHRPVAFRPSVVGLALPYAAAVPIVGLFILSEVRGDPSTVLLAGLLGVLGLVVARQFVALREYFALLKRAANFDDLTGLPNRRQFQEEMDRALGKRAAQAAVVLLGLDDLKAVNDSLGHDAGNEVIRRTAQVLEETFSGRGQVARLEGDEFGVLLPGAGQQAAEVSTHDFLEALRSRPIIEQGRLLRTTASAGIALVPDDGRTADDLLRCADLAMFQAKAAGGNTERFYDSDSDVQALTEARLKWKERIVEALERDRFVLFCQPIIDLRDRQAGEYEVLLRMLDEDGQLTPPAAFLEVAERFGLVHAIDRWVLSRAVAALAEQQRRGHATRLAVNLSGRAFEDRELLSFIKQLLTESEADPSRLILEVTETAAVADLPRAQQFIIALKELGCEFALDDFGIGFSSFSHLKHLPVDYLKIDGSFIRDLPRDEVDQHLVKAMVDVARGLKQRTVAEFVQDEETVRLLQEFGVDYGQGYYLGRPAPLVETLPSGQEVARRAA